MLRPDRTARAALCLAGLLWLAAWPQPDPAPEPCPQPVERAAREGHTRLVACDGNGGALRGPARRLFGQRLDLNGADARALEVLPGIGPARAAAIVAERARAPFAAVEELERVRGLGPRSVERLHGWVSVDGVSAGPGRGQAPGPSSR